MKKVLIITYYWPPAGGPGVHRVLRFVKYLPRLGWQPIVLTVEKGDYPALDPSLVKHIPEECQVFTAPTLEPFKLYRRITGKQKDEKLPTFILNKQAKEGFAEFVAKKIRANLFVPDARIGWLSKATHRGLEILRQIDVDLIFSSSPPHTVQLIARRLAAKSGIGWIADFRDPWTEAFWSAEISKNIVSRKIESSLERSVLSRANAITTVSPGLIKMFASKVEKKMEDFHVIETGLDWVSSKPVKTDIFRILFFGHLSKYQSPESLFRAIMAMEDALRKKIEVCFIGRIHDGFRPLIEQMNNINISTMDYLPHDQLIETAQQSSILFKPVAESAYSENSVGAKTFDYLSLRKPILVLLSGPDSRRASSVSKQILDDTQSGKLFDYDDISGIAGFIKHYFEIWQRKSYILLDNEDLLEAYKTEVNVKKLAALFERILGH